MELTMQGGRVRSLHFARKAMRRSGSFSAARDASSKQIDQYFRSRRESFSVPLALDGTAFQKKVWRVLRRIPFGETRSYRDIARAVGRPKASRACATACARNPVAVIVPCHRVIHQDGDTTGYAGGSWRKRWLLRHEQL